MSSSFIQIKPIGTHPMGMLPWNNPLTLLSSPDFPQARRRVASNLFGGPERGAINEIYRQEEKQRNEHFHQRYSFDLEEHPVPITKQQKATSKPTIITRPTITTTTISNAATKNNITAESRLSGGESLIEKELREHEMKLKQQQQRKKTVNCNEKLVVVAAAGDRIKSLSLKLEEHNATAVAVARTFVDSSKCASGGHGERPKPYARQQSSMTDYFAQRKTVVCNNNRTASEVPSVVVVEEATIEILPHLSDETVEVESPPTTKNTSAAVSNNESSSSLSSCSSSSSSSSSTHPHKCEEESSSQEQILHTLTTDVSAELA